MHGETSARPNPNDRPGLYVHLPFCRRKCAYCNFLTYPARSLVGPYLEALVKEARRWVSPLAAVWTAPDTLYLGGGTPSLLPSTAVADLVRQLRELFQIDPIVEITLEANPEDVTPETAGVWGAAGINRVTLGVQSVHSATLELMGRPPVEEAARSAVAALRAAGLHNFDVDLIVGLPGEERAHWSASLNFTLELEPAHLSLYLLEVGEKTVLGRRVRDGRWTLPSDDTVADFYLEALAIIETAGLPQYEISNFARPGFTSRHNCKYWELVPYLGLGCGAHSFDGARRHWNERDIRRYLERLAHGELPVAGRDEADERERQREFLLLGLREVAGVSRSAFRARFAAEVSPRWQVALKNYVVAGLVLDDNETFRLTSRGLLLSNEIYQELFHDP